MEQKIRSLHINTEKTWRGGEQQILYLVSALKDMGTLPIVVCQKGSELVDKIKAIGIRNYELNMRGEFDVMSAKAIADIANKDCVNIVHAHTSHAHSLAAIASIFFKRNQKLIVSRRVDFPINQNFLNKIKYRVPDRYIAVSKAIKKVMVNCGVPADKISVVHSGVYPEKFNGASREPLLNEFRLVGNEKIIGNIAHMADHKGQKYLIEAFIMLAFERDDVRLFIVGQGELESALKKQVADFGVKSKVFFTGFRKDIGNLYKLFDVFVISSHQEGLCTSILDSLMMKTPVVATNAGGIPEIIKDKSTGRLVRKKDAHALKDAIADILDNPDQASVYAENGYKFAHENFDYRLTAKKTLEVYRRLLS